MAESSDTNAGITADNSSFVEPTKESLTAALPVGLTLQEVAVRLAAGVCAAYSAYNNGSNLTPALDGYQGFQPIYVWESDPNVFPSWGVGGAGVGTVSAAPTRPAAYAVPNPCTGPMPPGTPWPGSQLFGFTATANDLSHNILVFRGTVTMQEAIYDLFGWGNNTDCMLPTQWWEKTNYGQVNSYLYAFYANYDLGAVTSLAKSTMDAIAATVASNPNKPWYIGGHSLGGAVTSLAALDAVASGAIGGSPSPVVFTFGSLHVGIQSFRDAYTQRVPVSARVANLCDFVPSMVSLQPVKPNPPYVHVGAEATFVWQTWDDWGNHSHASIYQPMVQSYWDVIQWGSRHYPQ